MEYEEVNEKPEIDPRLYAIPDIHGHAKGEHKAFSDERPIPLSARMLFLWFYHACRRGWPRFLMVSDHMNYLTFEDPAAINLVRRALKLAQAGDLYGAAETASVEVGHAAVVSEGLRRGMRYSIGAEVDNDPRSRPDAQNIVDAMKPDGMIRSVHFLVVDHPAYGPNWNWPFDNPEFADVFETVGTAKTWELYMATLLDAIERLPGNIVGHFYVPALFGHWPDDDVLDGYENALVDACESRGIAIELNTRFLYRDHTDDEKAKYLAAHRRLLAKCKAKNVGIAIGSDAHSPKDQGGGFATVLALLDECEINELVFPIGGRLLRVALRVERKAAEVVAEPVAIDERRPVRKARASVPPPAQGIPVEAAADEPALPKSKPRPKRSKAKPDDAGAENPVGLDVPIEANGPGETPDATALPPPDVRSLAVLTVEDAFIEPIADVVTSAQNDTIVETGTTEPALVDAIGEHETDVDPNASGAVSEPLATVPDVDPTQAASGAESDVFPVTEPPIAAETIDAPAITAPARSTPARPARSKPETSKAKSVPAKSKAPTPTAANAATKKSAKVSAKVAAPAKKTSAKKTTSVKKAVPKKAAAARPGAKKPAAKKAAVRGTGAKKSPAKKSAGKKAAPKKPAQRRR